MKTLLDEPIFEKRNGWQVHAQGKILKALLCVLLFVGLAECGECAAHWGFDEGNGEVVLDTVGGLKARVLRPDWVAGREGTALRFTIEPGSQARNMTCGVSLPVPAELFQGPFTVALWLKLAPHGPYREFKELLNFGGERGPGFRITYFYGSVFFRSGDGKQVSSVSTNPSSVFLGEERWLHVAGVYDGKEGRLYLNGERVASGPLALTQASGNLSVGSYRSGYAYPLHGAIDDLKIYGRALDDADVSSLYLNEMF